MILTENKIRRKAKDTKEMRREERKATKAKLWVNGTVSMKKVRGSRSEGLMDKQRCVKKLKKRSIGEVTELKIEDD